MRARLRADPTLVAAAIVTGMLVLKTLTLPAILKSGASDNHLLDWFAALAVLTGVVAAPAVRSALDGGSRPGPALLLLLGAGVPVQMVDPPLFPAAQSPADRATMAALVARVAASARPVVSDDMVLLLRAGKPVIWEPAIIAEPGAAAQYDEATLARLVRRGDFGFFVTAGVRGSLLFDERFNPAIADAMAAAYPYIKPAGRLTLHLPGDACTAGNRDR